MLQLSLRRNDSKIFFGTPTWTRGDDPTPLSLEEVQDELADTVPLVLIHGYNVDDAYDAYGRMVDNMAEYKIRYPKVVGVEWPGSEVEVAFLLAKSRANKAGELLAKELDKLPRCKGFDIEGHSLGCRVALKAAKTLDEKRSERHVASGVRLLVLAGAAVPHDSLASWNEFGHVPSICERLEVMYSMQDKVLKRAYAIAMFWRGKALGYCGPKRDNVISYPQNVGFYDLTRFIPSHSAYKKSPEFYKRWARALCHIGAKDACLTFAEGCDEC